MSLAALGLLAAYGIQDAPTWRTTIRRPPPIVWEEGQLVLQGFIGASIYENFELSDGSGTVVDGSGEDASQLPVIGGGGQWKLAGSGLDFGVEGLFSFAGRANAAAFAVGGGGATVAVSIDMLVFELYGGPFLSCFISERARVYAGGGGLMQWVDYTQDFPDTGVEDSGTGFGSGTYARAGIEFAVDDTMMVGFGVRWSESAVDLGPGLGDLSLDGFQFALTVTEGF